MTDRIVIVFVICSLILSGCPISDRSGGEIDFNGDLTASDGQFIMEGEIINAGRSDVPTFSDVTIYLYFENGTLIESRNIGELERRVNVSLQTEHIPKYVLIDSPEFWDGDDIDVSYFTYRDNRYGQSVIGSRDEFPVQPAG